MTDAPKVILRNGGLHLSRAVADLYFQGLDGIVLLRDGDDLLILPVRHAAAGGYLLKVRNGAGDRVAAAPDFFRQQGFSESEERLLSAHWDSARAGLVVVDAFHL